MARWIEISAMRVLEVTQIEYRNSYQRLNAQGDSPEDGEMTYRVVRESDGKVFKLADFVPREHYCGNDVIYLQDI